MWNPEESFELVRKRKSVAHDMVKQGQRIQRAPTSIENKGGK